MPKPDAPHPYLVPLADAGTLPQWMLWAGAEAMSLTTKQRVFVAEYLIDLNARQAAIRAGYSVRRAEVTGSELLSSRKVSEEVAKAMKARQERTHITQDRVLQELARIAFFDIRKLYRQDGTLKNPGELDDEAAAVLSGIDVTEHVNVEVVDGEVKRTPIATKKAKVFDKGAALTLAMRHLGMLTDKAEVTVTTKELPASVEDFV
jgi:phage terminase small subunit